MSNDKKTKGQLLQEELAFSQKHIAELKPKLQKKAWKFCEDYKTFLNKSKTEREFAENARQLLVENGYKEFEQNKQYKAGDKVYFVNRKKAICCATIGEKSIEKGFRVNAAHIDAPRIDLKPNPLYEDSDIALFKTHYYGGIKKYQWTATPLALHGVVCLKDGKTVDICIGEDEKDPVFCISDILPHLGEEQAKRPLSQGIKGEELNIIVGTIPYQDENVQEKVKLQVLSLLNQKYGMTERDFVRAEIEAVPAQNARDVGFDQSLIGAYGHDDRVCAYTALIAEIETKNPKYTSVCVLTDKEETGSDGNTGLNSDYMFHFLKYLCQTQNVDYKTAFANSKCLSADVNAAYDPTFPSVYEKRNSAYLNCGCVITKYTGARGKGDTSDASAETMGYVADLLDNAEVVWQTGELGAVDVGGGGTVAKYVANRNIDVVDIGVPLLSMHSPFEIASKLDIYMTYSAFVAFINDKK